MLFVASDSESTTNPDMKEEDSINDFIYMRAMKKRETLKNIGKPSSSDIHHVTIAIKQNNLDKLNDELMERSMPGGSKYQIWMEQNEVIALTSNQVATNAILKWCHENDLNIVWQNRHQEYFQVSTNISHWETLLRTEFYQWEDHHPHSVSYYDKPIPVNSGMNSNIKDSYKRNQILRAEYFSIPSHLQPHIHDIFGVVDPPSVLHKHLEKHAEFDNVDINTMHTEATNQFTITNLIHVYKIPPMNSSSKYFHIYVCIYASRSFILS